MTLQGYTSNFPDADLTPPNVKDGVDIFGVEGTFEGSGSGSFGTELNIVIGVITYYYYKIGNMFIFTHGNGGNDGLIASSARVRGALCTALGFTVVDAYIEDTTETGTGSIVWMTGGSQVTQSIAQHPRLVAMTLS